MPPYKPEDRAKWLSHELDAAAFQFIQKRQMKNVSIPSAAVAWEHYRYLFFTDQFPPKLNRWVSKGGLDKLYPKLVTRSLVTILTWEKFQTHAWHELDDKVQESLQTAFQKDQGSSPAATLLRHNEHTLSEWAYWTSQQLAQWQAKDTKSTDVKKFTRSLVAEPLQKHGPDRHKSQIILEVDWSRGAEGIKADFAKAIQPILKAHFPRGRKPRGTSSAKALLQLLFLKRNALHKMHRKAAAYMETGSKSGKIINDTYAAMTNAVIEAQDSLATFQKMLVDLVTD
jgi:hypothetical protein